MSLNKVEVKTSRPMQSKKFLAYLISELTSKGAMFYMMYHLSSKLEVNELTLLMTILICSTTLTVGYVLGESYFEKFVHSVVDIFDKNEKSKDANNSSNKKKEQ
jgi:hypothetical protein